MRNKGRKTALLVFMTLTLAAAGWAHGRGDDDRDRGDDADRRAKVQTAKIQELYADIVYPKSVEVMTGQRSVAHIFASDVRGRVTPAGHFHDSEAVNEYFFGLASTATSKVTSVAFRSLVANGQQVAVEIDIHF